MSSVAQPERGTLAAARPISKGGRGRLIRRVILFQIKLMADGFRDVVMSPLSIAAGIFGVIFGRTDPESYLDRLMRFGRDTDRWINLFDHRDVDGADQSACLDRVADDIERAVSRDYERGGLSARSAQTFSEIAMLLRRRASASARKS